METNRRIDSQAEEAVHSFLALIAPRYEILGAVLYGSRARGTHRPDSDADLAVILGGARRASLPTSLDMAGAAYDVLLETGVNISPLPIWADDWAHPESHGNPSLLENIAREGVPV